MATPLASDPILLAAQARQVIQGLHGRNDIVVRLKTNQSGFAEDALDKLDEDAPGHFRSDKRVLTLNLDKLTKAIPESLASVEDFRKHPILAGVAAHESAHAKFSLWGTVNGDEFPETIPNPDWDETHVHTSACTPSLCDTHGGKWGSDSTCTTCYDDEADEPKLNPNLGVKMPPCLLDIEEFPVDEHGQLAQIAEMLEEPRVERLGMNTFTKTWRRAMQLSAGHLVMEGVEEDDDQGKEPLDAALRLAILVGGRLAAGTLGNSGESRATAKRILASVEKIMETALPDVEDPFHTVMGLINKQVFSNEHTAPIPHLEAARQILQIIHPEQSKDPDNPDDGEGEGGGSGGGAAMPGAGESAEGEGTASAEAQLAMAAALSEMTSELGDALDALSEQMAEEVQIDMDQPESGEQQQSGGYGAVVYNNPKAPRVVRHEQPTQADRDLYKKARNWMEAQIEATVTEAEVNQWLPTGGARLDVRSHVRDNMAGHRANQRSDWSRVSETVKPAPPVKVAIMLDGSGSMSSLARPSAAIAWAAANAAADLPESRTVSVVYGAEAAVTQMPGHVPARDLAISATDGPWENFISAAKLVESALWLDEPVEEGQPSNVLIIIVSDLQYGKEGQGEGFMRITQEWADKGYRILVTGAGKRDTIWGTGKSMSEIKQIELVKMEELFQ